LFFLGVLCAKTKEKATWPWFSNSTHFSVPRQAIACSKAANVMITNEKDDYYVAPEKEKKKKQVDGDYQEPEYITITMTNPITHERTFS